MILIYQDLIATMKVEAKNSLQFNAALLRIMHQHVYEIQLLLYIKMKGMLIMNMFHSMELVLAFYRSSIYLTYTLLHHPFY